MKKDPIVYQGKEMSVDRLCLALPEGKSAGRIQIEFWTNKGQKVKGSLLDMVRDRMKSYRF